MSEVCPKDKNLFQQSQRLFEKLYSLEKDGLSRTEYFKKVLTKYNGIVLRLKKAKFSGLQGV